MFHKSTKQLLFIAICLGLILTLASSRYGYVDEFDYSDLFFNGLTALMCLTWLVLIRHAFSNQPSRNIIIAGIFSLYTGFYLDFMDEIYHIAGFINTIEPIAILSGMVLISGGLYLHYHYLCKQQKKEEEEKNQLYKASIFDPLTGIYNRNYFDEIYEKYLIERKNTDSFLVLIDVDNFKQINDELGHQKGDELLIKITKGIKKYASSDKIIRYGGDEFLIFYQGFTEDVVLKDIHDIMKFMDKKINLKTIGLSIGIAKEREQESFTSYFQRVDSAMYEAKKKGKNDYIYRP